MINGSGVVSGGEINIYWDVVSVWSSSSGTGLLGKCIASPEGSYSYNLEIPDTEFGSHYIWVKDITSNDIIVSNKIKVLPRISFSTTKGYRNDKIIVLGWGYTSNSNISIQMFNATHSTYDLFASEYVLSNKNGYIKEYFIVPNWSYGFYQINITDEWDNFDSIIFEIGPVLDVVPYEVSSGSIVTISGRGFTPGSVINNEDIKYGGNICYIYEDQQISVSNEGVFNGEIILSSNLPGLHEISVSDGVYTSESDILLVNEAIIENDKRYGFPGEVIYISGNGFTKKVDNNIILKIGNLSVTNNLVIDGGGNMNGSFILPAIKLGKDYRIQVIDDYNVSASCNLLISYVNLFLSEVNGVVGSKISVSSVGLKLLDGVGYEVYFDNSLLFKNTNVDDEDFSIDEFYVPQKPDGVYEIRLIDLNLNISISVNFNITNGAMLNIPLNRYSKKDNMTIAGKHFIKNIQQTVWYMFNETWFQEISDEVLSNGDVVYTDENGSFNAYFIIPNNIGFGKYTINSTTSSNDGINTLQYANITFIVKEDELFVNTRQNLYYTDDSVTFIFNFSVPKYDSTIYIMDSNNDIFWISTFFEKEWLEFKKNVWIIPVYYQIDNDSNNSFIIPSGYFSGNWSWVMLDANKIKLNAGTFNVVMNDQNIILDRMDNINNMIKNVNKEYLFNMSYINDKICDEEIQIKKILNNLIEIKLFINNITLHNSVNDILINNMNNLKKLEGEMNVTKKNTYNINIQFNDVKNSNNISLNYLNNVTIISDQITNTLNKHNLDLSIYSLLFISLLTSTLYLLIFLHLFNFVIIKINV